MDINESDNTKTVRKYGIELIHVMAQYEDSFEVNMEHLSSTKLNERTLTRDALMWNLMKHSD
jgi:hypothetical protein